MFYNWILEGQVVLLGLQNMRKGDGPFVQIYVPLERGTDCPRQDPSPASGILSLTVGFRAERYR